jgi:NAD(P) transhydrogenase subunit alpha
MDSLFLMGAATASQTPPLVNALWVLLLGSLLGFELIGKVPPTLHTPLMSGANAISGITMLAALTAVIKADGSTPLLVLGSVSLGFALFNVIGGFLVTDRMLAMFSRKPARKENS